MQRIHREPFFLNSVDLDFVKILILNYSFFVYFPPLKVTFYNKPEFMADFSCLSSVFYLLFFAFYVTYAANVSHCVFVNKIDDA